MRISRKTWLVSSMALMLDACGVEGGDGIAPSSEPFATAAQPAPLAAGARCSAPSLALGSSHTCLVRSEGTVACWGANASRQLGAATPSYAATPTDVAGVSGAIAVTAGSQHSCALLADGTVWCWGANAAGQLGTGAVAKLGPPSAVQGLAGITALAAGTQHTCALRNDGTVWCWGSNGSGRLGDGTTARRSSPVQVQGLADARAITAGDAHTCALTRSGAAYCWGSNSYGQLGDETRTARRGPVAVAAGHVWRSLAAGQYHTCGVLQAPGNGVRCWGRDVRGQLGDGAVSAYQATARVAVDASGDALTDGVMVSAGGSTSCLVSGDGSAACWGYNAYGQVGDGTSTSRASASPVAASAPLSGAFLLIANGLSHSCAIAVSGQVFCWGANGAGQLGDGTRTRRGSPTQVGGAGGLTFGPFAAEDERSSANGAGASHLLAAGDELLVAGRERGASSDAWVLRRSRDRGANWTTVASYTFGSGTSMQPPHLARLASGTLFLAGAAANDDGDTAWVVRRSSDGGDTWSDVGALVFDRSRPATLLGAATDATGHVYLAGSADDAAGTHWLVRASADGGATWFVADDLLGPSGAAAHAVLDAGGLFVAGHVPSATGAHLRVRRAAAVVASDRATSWTDADDFQYAAGFDTIGEALATDLGGAIYVLARANSATGWRWVLRVSADGGTTWQTRSTFQLAEGADTTGYGLFVDRAGTLHVAGAAARSGASPRGLVASSYDHGATWVVADELGAEGMLTGVAEDATGSLHAVGTFGSGALARWTVRTRACVGLAPSCGNWVIDPGERCDGDCSDCDDHDACTTDVMTGAASTCDVACANTPITACTSGDGCCAPGCTSAQDLDCCTGPIESGACVDLSFRLEELSATGCTTLEHSQVTGASRSALAVTSSKVFYTGSGPTSRGLTGRFDAQDLSGGRATTSAWDQMFSDLRTGTAYVLGSGTYPLTSLAGTAVTLIPLDPETGRPTTPRITLSQRIQVAASRSFFSGYGRLVLHNGARLYDVQIPSGQVTELGSMVLPEHNTCASSAAWGLAESFSGAVYLDYVAGDRVQRTRIPDGATTTVATFTNLGDTCALGFSTASSRWYFHHSGASQFASGSQILGTCPARYRRPNATPVCGDGVLEADEVCEGECPYGCDGLRPVPVLATVTPTSVAAGSADLTLTLTGSDFAADSVVRFDGRDVATTWVSQTALTAIVPAARLASAGVFDVTVFVPAPGGGTSGPVAFEAYSPVPELTAISPVSALAGASGLTLTLTGASFANGAVVTFGGVALATTRVSASQLTAVVPAALVASGGTFDVRVTNPGANGASSPAFVFAVVASSAAERVAGGYYHTCAIHGDGTVWCLGWNNHGTLGDGTYDTANRTPVRAVGLTNVVQISGDTYTMCARKSDGTVWCWGWNSNGGLGNGTTVESTVPVRVSNLTNVVEIATGVYHSCARKADRTVWCWGVNSSGQLGNGTTTDSSVPVQVTGITTAAQISTGGWGHVCAVLTDGTAQCWGANDYGQLGINSVTRSTVPVTIPSLTNVTSIDAGYRFTCAVRAEGTASCWGANDQGQLGIGSTTRSLVPVDVPGLTNVSSIGTLTWSTCAVLADGTARCWGRNVEGENGNGTSTESQLPVVVTGLTNARRLATCYFHVVAVEGDGTLRAWGDNAYGQLGDGTSTSARTPVVASF